MRTLFTHLCDLANFRENKVLTKRCFTVFIEPPTPTYMYVWVGDMPVHVTVDRGRCARHVGGGMEGGRSRNVSPHRARRAKCWVVQT